MVTDQREQKITYTTMGVEQAESFNRAFDQALASALTDLGREYTAFIDGQPRQTHAPTFESRSPDDTRIVLGAFQECGREETEAAVSAARRAFPGWARTPWREHVEVMRRAADNFRVRKYEIAAWLTIEAGKSRLEAMGEVEEAADLITTYCDQMEQHDGFVIKLNQLTPQEINHSVLRPYGVWVVIAPFNFPVALATGMLAGALVAGNTVVFKPSSETPLCGVQVYQCLADAGLPPGVVNFVTGMGNATGELLSGNPGVDGIAFTGSKAVGTHVYTEFSRERPRPCIAEMGGKNPVIVTDRADMSKAVEGTVRAAFGYAGQKCSAASRVYVLDSVADEFVRRFKARTEELSIGNPIERDVFVGPVINRRAYDRFTSACDTARHDGEIVTGGTVLTEDDLQYGYYCAPTIARLDAGHEFFYEELFVPFIVVASVPTLDDAISRANDSEYGLTAGIFTEDPGEARTFLERIEAGVVYVNRRGGATTGAWPGVQSFGGWKASGSTGKSALGPYYVQQFLHEQNQTVVTD
ncbi:MAG TPA: aldehyde dehydrogenase family protein [Chloroflexota bacterium]|nr:aldehyde dehydrogenase family protein [Chloroflexota bacterium]